MGTKLFFIASLFVGSVVWTNALADDVQFQENKIVQTQNAPFSVHFSNNTAEQYVVRYKASIKAKIWETGHVSKPLKGWFIDTRRCHLLVQKIIYRQVCQLSELDGVNCTGPYSQQYFLPISDNAPGPSLTRIQGENCNDTRSSYMNTIGDQTAKLNNDFGSFVNNNLKKLLSNYEARQNVVSITKR